MNLPGTGRFGSPPCRWDADFMVAKCGTLSTNSWILTWFNQKIRS